MYKRQALKLAIEQRLIARNPADGCALPKAERKEMQTLPVEQLTSFLREAKDSGVFALYYIDLTTGLRPVSYTHLDVYQRQLVNIPPS